MSAQVTLTIQEYEDLRDKLVKAETHRNELVHLLSDIRDAEAVAKNGETWAAALQIVQFAVANLPPETSPGWPYNALRLIARHLTSPSDLDLAGVFDEFASIAEGYETARKKAPRKITSAGPRDFGPKTTEAAIMHAIKTGDTTPLKKLVSNIPEEPTSPGEGVEDEDLEEDGIVDPPDEEAPAPSPDE
jgi:hypothetical protein